MSEPRPGWRQGEKLGGLNSGLWKGQRGSKEREEDKLEQSEGLAQSLDFPIIGEGTLSH
jgi:hypothetical protein